MLSVNVKNTRNNKTEQTCSPPKGHLSIHVIGRVDIRQDNLKYGKRQFYFVYHPHICLFLFIGEDIIQFDWVEVYLKKYTSKVDFISYFWFLYVKGT